MKWSIWTTIQNKRVRFAYVYCFTTLLIEYIVVTDADEVNGVYSVLTIYNEQFLLKKEGENIFLFKTGNGESGKNRWEINRSIKYDRLGEYYSSESTDLNFIEVEKWFNYDHDLSSVVISDCGEGEPTRESCRCTEVTDFVQF